MRFTIAVALLVSSTALAEQPKPDPNARLTAVDGRLALGVVAGGGSVTEGFVLGRIGLHRGPLWRPRLVLLPEVGGGRIETDDAEASTMMVGLGVGAMIGPFVLGVVPSLVGGDYNSESADGARLTGLVEVIGIAGFQVSRQRISAGTERVDHTIVTGSLNLAVLALMLVGS